MKHPIRQALALAVCLSGLAPLSLAAQIVLTNPGLPGRETMVYSDKTGDKRSSTRQTVTLKEEAGKSWYEVSVHSEESDVTYKVDARTMSGFYSDVLERSTGSLIRRTNEVLSYTLQPKKDELVVADLNSYITSLRGFPFASSTYAKVIFAGNPASTGGYSMEINVLGKETVKIGGASYDCYKLQLGLAGFLGGLIPKTQYWYAAKAPHYLVRFEGSRGGPGAPVTVLELQSYEASN